MEKGFVENGFIIDLSDAKNTTQLVFELSSIMEHPEVKRKNVCLKLGALDLKQSQLLSIKALIESMDANLAFIDTDSEQTEASAVSLGIIVSEISDNLEPSIVCTATEEVKDEEVVVKTECEVVEEEEKTVEVHADLNANTNPIETAEGIEDIYDEQSMQELSEIIPAEHFETNFEALAENEGLIKAEEASKYILLDTGDVLPEGAEENDTNTDAHPGSEIVAGGDITVWGILGGIAHAGSLGNVTSKVRALKLNAIQLRIAGLYARRNDTLNVPYVQKTNEFTPEEAQIEDGKIVIYKKLRRD